MSMSKRSQAIFAAEQKNEWNKYMKSFADAKNAYLADMAAAQEEGDKRSGWQKLLGTIFFTAAAATYFAVAKDPVGAGAIFKKGLAASAVGAVAGTAASGATAEAQNLVLDDIEVLPDEYKAMIDKPMYGKGRADAEITQFEGGMERDVETLDDWYEDAWSTSLYENIGRGSSFMSNFAFKPGSGSKG